MGYLAYQRLAGIVFLTKPQLHNPVSNFWKLRETVPKKIYCTLIVSPKCIICIIFLQRLEDAVIHPGSLKVQNADSF